MNRRRFCVRALAIAALIATLPLAAAPGRAESEYPNRPVHLIVGFAAGGGNDVFGRLIAAKLSELIGQPVVVENRPGAGGRLAAEYVAKESADGYTLLVGASGAMSIAAAIYPDLKYQPTETFAPLGMIANFPLIMAIAADSPAKTVQDVVDWAKQHPDKANYATTSPAFTIATELLKLKSGMPGTAIPYRSSNDMIFSVIGGQTLMAIADGPPVMPQVKAGKVKAVAVTGAARLSELPDVPSMAEAGYAAVDIRLWSGIFAPAATPQPILAKLETALGEALRDPGVSAKLKNLAVEPGRGTAAEFRQTIERDIVTFRHVVADAKLHFEE